MNSDELVDTGEGHHKAGRLQEAEACYRRALELDPGHPGALYYLANIAYDDNRLQLATQLIDRLLRDEPNDAEAWHLLGVVALKDENFPRAIECFHKATAIQPAYFQAYGSLGNAFSRLNELGLALDNYHKALSFNPEFGQALSGLGHVLQLLNRPVEAIAHYRHAIALDPSCANAYRNLGNLLIIVGKFHEGIATLRKAASLQPQDPELRSNLALALYRMGRLGDANDCLQEALKDDPNNSAAHSIMLVFNQYLPGYSREKLLSDHLAFGDYFEAPLRKFWPEYPKPTNSNKRLRVGFVSGDLCSHPVGYFLEGVLRELHRLNGVDIVVYAFNVAEDQLTDRLRASTHTWASVYALSDDAFERRIRNDNIDILIDLSGHTVPNRLLVFARKPAPIQVTWLGYWDTTGLRAIDYILCDRFSVHEEEERFLVERPWYLPHTRLCFTLPDEEVGIAPLPASSNGYVTFGCFNNLVKMTDRVVSVWSRILKRIPNARLLLKWSSFDDLSTHENVKDRFAREGISADRLELEASSPRLEYFFAYNRVDIALDPFPFPGGTTSVEGIWMGVPVITLRGDRIISRQGEGVLRNLDLADWIAPDEDSYVEMAVRRAGDLSGLASLRGQLRERLTTSPLCDAKQFAQNLEKAFGQMWEEYCNSPRGNPFT